MQKPFREKAEITIFLTMIILLVSSAVFALLETAREKGLDVKAECVHDIAGESVLAEYQQGIYRQYGLLLLDGAVGGAGFQIRNVERRLEEKNDKNLCGSREEQNEFYRLSVSECRIPRYQLAADEGGKVFRHLAAQAAKRNTVLDLVEDFSAQIQEKSEFEIKNKKPEDYMEEAVWAEENVIPEEKRSENTETEDRKETKEIEKPDVSADADQKGKNPIHEAKAWKKSAVLSLVMREESPLSQKAIPIEDSMAKRNKEQGNLAVMEGALDEMWFLQYLETHMGSYGAEKEGHALDYEMEYILCGKSSDRENLEESIKSLIAIREIANLAYLLSDAGKCLEAEELAVSLMGWTVNPAVIAVTKMGILGAWACSESILDVRRLLEGGKIAWIKDAGQWTTGLSGMGTSVEGFAMAKNCENGWSYQKYLKFLYCFRKDSDINYRSMDIVEVNTNLIEGEQVRMNEMITAVQTDLQYEAEPLFWNYVQIGNLGLSGFSIRKEGIYSYL